MKDKISTIALLILFFIGLSLLLYPSFSDYYNSFHQTRAIVDYENVVKKISSKEYTQLLTAAQDYNKNIPKYDGYILNTPEQMKQYNSLLNVMGNGMMGHIEIPLIQVSMPIYHGTGDKVLQFAVGHLDWSSLPVGGKDTHCLLSSHRGLPSARLFSDLDRLTEGDTFKLYILDEVLTYKVDKISVVQPEDTSRLRIIEDGDFCTLITCTPYGINTERLLVRGQRIKTEDNIHSTGDAVQVDPMVVAPIISVPFVLGLIIFVMIRYRNS